MEVKFNRPSTQVLTLLDGDVAASWAGLRESKNALYIPRQYEPECGFAEVTLPNAALYPFQSDSLHTFPAQDTHVRDAFNHLFLHFAERGILDVLRREHRIAAASDVSHASVCKDLVRRNTVRPNCEPMTLGRLESPFAIGVGALLAALVVLLGERLKYSVEEARRRQVQEGDVNVAEEGSGGVSRSDSE